MSNMVDYDEMFDKKPKQKSEHEPDLRPEHFRIPEQEIAAKKAAAKEAEWQERYQKDLAERNKHSEVLENFRNGPKHYEGYFERSEGFAEMRYGDTPPPIYMRRARSRYYSLKRTDFIFEYIDGFLGALLFGIVVWALFPSLIPVTIAAAVGFISGVVLKLRVRDRYNAAQAFDKGLPIFIAVVLIAAIIIFSYLFL